MDEPVKPLTEGAWLRFLSDSGLASMNFLHA